MLNNGLLNYSFPIAGAAGGLNQITKEYMKGTDVTSLFWGFIIILIVAAVLQNKDTSNEVKGVTFFYGGNSLCSILPQSRNYHIAKLMGCN